MTSEPTRHDRDILKPDISERGFAYMPEITSLEGTAVHVHESSLATQDAIWLAVRQLNDWPPQTITNDHGDTLIEISAHLDMTAALDLAEQIRALAARRGHPTDQRPATPATWKHLVRAFRTTGWVWRGHAGPARTANPVDDDGRPDRRLGSVTVTHARGRWRVTVQGPGSPIAARTVDLINPGPADVLDALDYVGIGPSRLTETATPADETPFLNAEDARAETHSMKAALARIVNGEDPRVTLHLHGRPLTRHMLDVLDTIAAAATANAWREAASWVRHQCTHQMGVPVCTECLALADTIAGRADNTGGQQ